MQHNLREAYAGVGTIYCHHTRLERIEQRRVARSRDDIPQSEPDLIPTGARLQPKETMNITTGHVILAICLLLLAVLVIGGIVNRMEGK